MGVERDMQDMDARSEDLYGRNLRKEGDEGMLRRRRYKAFRFDLGRSGAGAG
jgi:hypothetical protein